ncbi:hypothetical protein C8R45DRAFT_978417 [Mycena sanguinolenta]|nr:hypothetical protein C8R45DRAFT_978417 [Mycena sanguinolenta]
MLFKRKSRTLETQESSPPTRTRFHETARGAADAASRPNPQRATRGTTRQSASGGSGPPSSMKAAAAAPASSQDDREVVPQSDSGSDSEDDISIDQIASRRGFVMSPAAKALKMKRTVVSSADEDEGIVSPSKGVRQKLPREAFESGGDGTPRPRTNVRRRDHDLSVEDEDEEIVSPPKRRKLPSEAFESDADNVPRSRTKVRRRDDDLANEAVSTSKTPVIPRKRVRHRSCDSAASPSEGEESGELPTIAIDASRPRKRLHRHNSDVDESSADNERVDPRVQQEPTESTSRAGDDLVSNADSADINDLEYSPPPTPSKPTPKERKNKCLNDLKNARQKKSSPTSVRVEKKETDNEESEPLAWESSDTDTDSDGEESEGGSDSSSAPESFIDDEDETSETDAAVQKALAPALRQLRGHFSVFVEFLVRLYLKPELFNELSGEEDYKAAIAAVRKYVDSAALTSEGSTWSTPFKRTLQDRPLLVGPYGCEYWEHGDCQACWTRGKWACSAAGCFVMWTHEGFYDRETFEDKPEINVKYAKETTRDFENSAQVETFHYPSGFRFIVGQACAQRAQKYHRARHSLYNMLNRVKAEVELARTKDADLVRSRNLSHLMEEMAGFVRGELWNAFQSDCGKLLTDD